MVLLKGLVIADSIIIALLAISIWLGGDSTLSFAIMMVAACALQIIGVVAWRRKAGSAATRQQQ